VKKLFPFIKSLWAPFLVAVLFLAASAYQQEIIIRLGVKTIERFLTYFPLAVGVGIWLSLAYLFNRALGVVVWDSLSRRMPIPRLLRDVTAVLIYAIAITGIVGAVFDKPIGPFWAASGAGAIVIGLALRNVILDIFIGLAMNFDRPFEIGDFIQVANGPTGRVVELNWRTTRLETAEGNLVVLPNGKLGEMTVTNFSKPKPTAEQSLPLFLDFEVDTRRAMRVLNAAARSVTGQAGILEAPMPKAQIRAITPQGVEYKIIYEHDPTKGGIGKARHIVLQAVLEQLHRAGLQPAIAKQDVFQAPRPQRHFDVRSLEDRVAIISRVELFQSLTPDECAQLCKRLRERSFAEGSVVIQRGAPDTSMFILIEGLLNVMLSLKEGEPESRVARLQAGMFFGEMSALTGERRSVSVLAATDSLAFEITKDDLAELIQKRPELAETISRVVVARKMRNSESITQASMVLQQAAERSLAAELVGKILTFFGVRKTAPTGVTPPPFPMPPGSH
jgi:small-conductance mechanosensitive channel/CRP-like cAMP-binding protein